MDDPSLSEISVNLLLVLLFVFANGFFVASEFALVTVRRSWVETLAAKGDRRGRVLLSVVSDLDSYIAATQLGITIASLSLGWIGEPALASLVRPLFENLPSSLLTAAASHTLAVALAFSLITFLHVVLGELAPKTLALERQEKIALAVARPMLWFYYLFYPFIRLLNGSGLFFLRLLRLPPTSSHRAMYAEEIQQMINASRESGLLEAHAHQILTNAFDFGDIVVREVMRPRADVTSVPVTTSADEVIRLFQTTGYSRLPVYRDQPDNIIGVLYSKDLLPALHQTPEITVEALLRPPFFVPDATALGDALRQMRQSKTHFAIVVDEYGAIEGIVTMEDILEEIVGEIRDEHDLEEGDRLVRQPDGAWLIDGTLTVRDANRELPWEIPESDGYTTVAGFVLSIAGKFPAPGESIRHEDLVFTVQQVKGRRISRVRMEHQPETALPATAPELRFQTSDPFGEIRNPNLETRNNPNPRHPNDQHYPRLNRFEF
jgi:CBS domain containing-hemolysin-like protein